MAGLVSGTDILINARSNYGVLTITAKVTGTQLSGTYVVTGGACDGNGGTFSGRRRERRVVSAAIEGVVSSAQFAASQRAPACGGSLSEPQG